MKTNTVFSALRNKGEQFKGNRREKKQRFIDFYFLPKKVIILDCFLAFVTSRTYNDLNRCKRSGMSLPYSGKWHSERLSK